MKRRIWLTTGLIIIAAVAGFAFINFRQNRPEPYQPTKSNIMQQSAGLKITSPAFEEGATIPVIFTCNGENVNPPLVISGVPREAKSLALVMHDPDAPIEGGWTHWLKWNIPPETSAIVEGKEPVGVSGKGSGNNLSYQGPCPPSGTHRYVFKIFALNTILDLPKGSSKTALEAALVGHLVGQGELVGVYSHR